MKWKVFLTFSHLKNWRKQVIIEAKTKRKAMIAAEKAFPQGKAEEAYLVSNL